MQNRPYSLCISLSLDLLVVWLLIFLLVSKRSEVLFEQAALITPGMSAAEVRQILGKSDSLAGCVFVPVQAPRENGELKVDAVKIVPSFSPLCPGLDVYTLHSRQEDEFYVYWGKYRQEEYGIWLGKSCTVVVFFDQQKQVQKVFALPTTYEPGDLKVWLQWQISRWLK
jgi:hypothetical protein